VNGEMAESDIKNVAFLFGTSGAGTLPSHEVSEVPGPASILMLGIGLLLLAAARFRKTSAPEAAAEGASRR
jgi:hypothetical protein